jgi:hypothetical protein
MCLPCTAPGIQRQRRKTYIHLRPIWAAEWCLIRCRFESNTRKGVDSFKSARNKQRREPSKAAEKRQARSRGEAREDY